MIQAQGSKSFIDALSKNVLASLGDRLGEEHINTQIADNFSTAKWSIKMPPPKYSNEYYLCRSILHALEKTLQQEQVLQGMDATIQVGKVEFELEEDLSKAISEANEVAYLMTYDIDEKLTEKEKKVLKNLMYYFFDIFALDVNDYELYANRCHDASLMEPISANRIDQLLTGIARVLQEFSAINKVTCVLKWSGNVLE